MKVSIITVCYNSEVTIRDTIESVLEQSYLDIEYILLDGKSKDSTLRIINEYKDRISVIKSEKDNGMYDAINRGIQISAGDLIGILNSDDVYKNANVISDVVSLIQKENTDACYGDLIYVKRDDLSKLVRYWKSGKYKEGYFKYGWMPPHPSFFVKKECYERFGLFNLDVVSAADYELMLRFIHVNRIKLSYLERVLVKMRDGGISNASFANRLRGNAEDKKAWDINGLRLPWYTLKLKPLRKIGQYLPKKKGIN